jgi:hypothetical protein
MFSDKSGVVKKAKQFGGKGGEIIITLFTILSSNWWDYSDTSDLCQMDNIRASFGEILLHYHLT